MTASPRPPKVWRATPPKLWRIRGKAADGMVVTLGRYTTEPEAQVDFQRLTHGGVYRNLELEALDPPADAPVGTPPG
jgi:hypothetical protein